MSSSGTVKKWFDDKGFGFVCPAEGGDDVFVHRLALVNCESLEQGDTVTYDSEWDDRKSKYKAANVSSSGGGGGGDYGKGGGKSYGKDTYGKDGGKGKKGGYDSYGKDGGKGGGKADGYGGGKGYSPY